ncbi:cobalt ABC transporter ATP-binding protein [Floricoccus tropicus]|uniref:Energy-coupling factor transporter transmembrane protein EcfT n=1 Tax=Floricoccus tropicus TaxID=1859473 RepID=A0A1E8GL71_9LACT|nr:energy-coupling factor transporter transmembrane protein EcfT [Floricoccus tropicus]OFI49000.1 cobalt ABC transporter ATP-binding protein [Floricoccus tropicus]
MDKIIMGRYIPGDSIIHRMDPRSKLLAMFAFVFVIFMATDLVGYGILFAYTVLAVVLSKIKISYYYTGLKPMFGLIIFTALFQILFTASGETIFKFWIINITTGALMNALYMSLRLILIIILSTVLTLTTAPLTLADGVATGLAPLKKIGVPVYDIGLMLSISLRFIPTLMDDTTRIMNAQRSRGMDFGEGNLIQKIKSVIPILIPLFVSSFKRADDLAIAMESRGFQGGDNRSKYRILKWHFRDTALILSIVVLIAILFMWNSFIK